MTDINKEDTNENTDIFNNGEFVFMEKTTDDGEKEFIGGGYKIDSFFLKKGIAPMTTYNTSSQSGGQMSSPFENLAVPAGLFYVNMRIPKNNIKQQYEKHTMVPDEIMDKLYSLIEVNKKQKRKTKKIINNNKKTKTRKQR